MARTGAARRSTGMHGGQVWTFAPRMPPEPWDRGSHHALPGLDIRRAVTAGSREDGAKLWGWGWCGGAPGDGVCVSRMPVLAPHPHLLPACGEKGASTPGPGRLAVCGLWALGGAVAQLPSPRLRGEGPGRGMRGGWQCLWICVGLAVGAAAMPVPAPHPHLLPADGEKGASTLRPAFRRGGHDWKIVTGQSGNGQAVASETVASMWSTSGSGRRRRPASMSR